MDQDPESHLSRDDLLALLETANQLNTVDTLKEVLMQILDLAGRLSDSEAGSVILYNQERNDLYFAAATGPVADRVQDVRIPLGKGKAGEVYSTGIALIANSLEEHYQDVDKKTLFVTKSMICIPLDHKDRRYGVMQILNKARGNEPYDNRDLALLTRFGVQATIAINNATLFEQMLSSSGLHAEPEVRKDLVQRVVGARSAIKEKFTVLFADMRRFSQLSNMIGSPARIQTILTDYILMLSTVMLRHNGIVNKVMGDGLVAIFRGQEGVSNAVRAAFDALDGFDRLRIAWNQTTRFSLDFVDIGIGIATDDELIFGQVGDDTFRDFTLIGPAVNLAAGLVKFARDGKRVLCDNLTYAGLKSTALARGDKIRYASDKSGPLGGITYDVYKLSPIEPQKGASLRESTDAYDIFFSYRREGGSLLARSLQQALKADYTIFLDVDRLPSGHFDEALLSIIESAPNFVLFLSSGSLDNCQLQGDWLRKEIAHALKTGRNIVPVTMPEFEFPDPESLPADIREVLRYDAVEYNHRYFYAMLDKLREHLKKTGGLGA
ncbi:MAG TPA: GAF domain-containing protein [Blastocatellia bacterium]|nr:GAF domain-containing protein [Blastocatellia bacterium]